MTRYLITIAAPEGYEGYCVKLVTSEQDLSEKELAQAAYELSVAVYKEEKSKYDANIAILPEAKNLKEDLSQVLSVLSEATYYKKAGDSKTTYTPDFKFSDNTLNKVTKG